MTNTTIPQPSPLTEPHAPMGVEFLIGLLFIGAALGFFLFAAQLALSPGYAKAEALLLDPANIRRAEGLADCVQLGKKSYYYSASNTNAIYLRMLSLPPGWIIQQLQPTCRDSRISSLPVEILFVVPAGGSSAYILRAAALKPLDGMATVFIDSENSRQYIAERARWFAPIPLCSAILCSLLMALLLKLVPQRRPLAEQLGSRDGDAKS